MRNKKPMPCTRSATEIVGPTHSLDVLHKCASIMSASDPWVFLSRDFQACFKALKDPMKEVYIAKTSSKKLAGFILLCLQGSFKGYIQSICVHPDFRNQRIGTQLIQFAEQRIFRTSPNVFLCVSSFNPKARSLYERLGYTLIGELEDYIVEGHSEFLLRKTLGPLSDFKPAEEP